MNKRKSKYKPTKEQIEAKEKKRREQKIYYKVQVGNIFIRSAWLNPDHEAGIKHKNKSQGWLELVPEPQASVFPTLTTANRRRNKAARMLPSYPKHWIKVVTFIPTCSSCGKEAPEASFVAYKDNWCDECSADYCGEIL